MLLPPLSKGTNFGIIFSSVHSSENDQGEDEYFFLKDIFYVRGLIISFYKELSVLLFVPDLATLKHSLEL